jgi:hypothetical protein
MSTKTKKASILASALGTLSIALLLAWVFSRQSVVGLFLWDKHWQKNFIEIGAAGLLPLLLGLASVLGIGRIKKGASAFLTAATFAFSALALALGVGLFAYVLPASRSTAEPIPAVALLDPSLGIPGAQGVARLSLSSDPHWGVDTSDAAARRAILASVAAARPRRDALIILGDNVETGMDDIGWHEEAKDLSSLLGGVPVRPMFGNHDGLIDGQFHFEKYFFPASMRTDTGSTLYYSMKAGAAEIIVLNLLWGAESFDARQAAWLEERLSELPPGQQAIVLSHAFIFSSGYVDEFGYGYYDNPRTIARIAPILERHKVALVVSGHNHYMELLRKNGVTYAVVGAMGGVLDPEPSYRSPASVWFKQGVHGRVDLDISAAGIALAFRDQDGKALYETSIPAAR